MNVSVQCYHVYIMLSAVFALFMFITGFFSMTVKVGSVASESDIPLSAEEKRINDSSVFEKQVDRLIIMVIDAFRVDFIDDETNGGKNMPYTYSLIQNMEACILTGLVNPPTVTMPRIKAMTTGAVPNFVDIVYNLGSSEINQDNIIEGAEKHGMNVLFFGDDTWLKLFPNSFLRKDGTTSFFVSDFTEVDDNVTRHLDRELKRDDWTIMILHYLGLDHIGHLEGPRSSRIQPKLLEMDSVVQKIHQRVQEWTLNSSLPSLLVICGDHGMKDSGGHGGASVAETTVPIVTVGITCTGNSSRKQKIVSQIDVAPTLSFLLGLPIPKDNIGKIIPLLMGHIPIKKRLFALFCNAKQIAVQYALLPSGDSKDAYLDFKEGVRLHSEWLASPEELNEKSLKAEELYTSALSTMSAELIQTVEKYDTHLMFIALSITYQLCYISLFRDIKGQSRINMKLQMISYVILFYILNKFLCSITQEGSILCLYTGCSSVIPLTCLAVLALNAVIIRNSCTFSITTLFHTPSNVLWFIAGSFLHVMSLLSTSAIEEEHQFWYFLWCTFLLVILYRLLQCFYLGGHKEALFIWIIVTVFHRFLRKLNQTGDKWAHLPDISNWLQLPEHQVYLSTYFALCLVGNFLCFFYLNLSLPSPGILDTLLYGLPLVAIYCYRSSTGAVLRIYDNFESKGVDECKIFYCFVALLLCKQLVWSLRESNHLNRITHISASWTGTWILLTTLLHRPHNAVLPCIQMLASVGLHALYQQTRHSKADMCWLTLAHTWLGMVFYFYQGNSSSLATIDVAAGYTGLQDYNEFLVGVLLVANTYSAPILSYLLLLHHILQEGRGRGSQWIMEQVNVMAHTLICNRLTLIAVYLSLMTFQRYHLFVWTVFSPKLFYESAFTVLTFIFITVIYILLFTVRGGISKVHK